MQAYLIDSTKPFVELEMENYYVKVELYMRHGKCSVNEAHGLLLKTGKDEFTIMGTYAVISFRPKDTDEMKAGLGPVNEYVYRNR